MPAKRTPSGRSKSQTRSPKKKSPAKRQPSKSPGRAKPKKPISKTPTPAKSRSRSVSRGRKPATAPAGGAGQRRSRSRSQSKKVIQQQQQQPVSASRPQHHSLRQRHLAAAHASPRPRSRSSGGVSGLGCRVLGALTNNPAVSRVRRAFSRQNTLKAKKHCKAHWKHYALALLVLLVAVVAYKFGNEIATNVRQINKNVYDFVSSQYESKRKIFG